MFLEENRNFVTEIARSLKQCWDSDLLCQTMASGFFPLVCPLFLSPVCFLVIFQSSGVGNMDHQTQTHSRCVCTFVLETPRVSKLSHPVGLLCSVRCVDWNSHTNNKKKNKSDIDCRKVSHFFKSSSVCTRPVRGFWF